MLHQLRALTLPPLGRAVITTIGGHALHTSAFRRTVACIAVAALVVASFTLFFSDTRPAKASGCSVPPCGALTNHTTDTRIGVKWSDDNGKTWQYDIVEPNTTKGGWWNDGIDVDFWYIPAGCTDRGGIGGTPGTWTGEQWAKISSDQTVVIDSRTCS
jgi:hypothetical protein